MSLGVQEPVGRLVRVNGPDDLRALQALLHALDAPHSGGGSSSGSSSGGGSAAAAAGDVGQVVVMDALDWKVRWAGTLTASPLPQPHTNRLTATTTAH